MDDDLKPGVPTEDLVVRALESDYPKWKAGSLPPIVLTEEMLRKLFERGPQ